MCLVRLIGEDGGSFRCESLENSVYSFDGVADCPYLAARWNSGPVSLRGCTIASVIHAQKARMIANLGRSRDCRRERRRIMDVRCIEMHDLPASRIRISRHPDRYRVILWKSQDWVDIDLNATSIALLMNDEAYHDCRTKYIYT